MWLDPDDVLKRLAHYLEDPPIETTNSRDSNYERNAFDGDIVRHHAEVRTIVLHETATPTDLPDIRRSEFSLTNILFGTRKKDNGSYFRGYNIYINRLGMVYVTFYYPTYHVSSSPELWDIPEDELNMYGFSIGIECNNDITQEQLEATILVCAAVMDVADLESDRIVSDLVQDIAWCDDVDTVRKALGQYESPAPDTV